MKILRLCPHLLLSCCLLIALVAFPQGCVALESVATAEGLALVRAEDSGTIVQKKATDLRNPFAWTEAVTVQREASMPKPEPEIFRQLVLSGIIWDNRTPLAVIDDTLLAEGDTVEGVTVRNIFHDEVLVEKDNEYYSLRFPDLLDLGENGMKADQ